ncbi:MAG: hypothetical protein ABIB71_04150 [Candidatus Woesearchaeota archaeon]
MAEEYHGAIVYHNTDDTTVDGLVEDFANLKIHFFLKEQKETFDYMVENDCKPPGGPSIGCIYSVWLSSPLKKDLLWSKVRLSLEDKCR